MDRADRAAKLSTIALPARPGVANLATVRLVAHLGGAGGSRSIGVVGVGPKFAVHDNAVNVHASNLEQSESAMNAQGAAFLRAIEPLPQDWKGSSFSSWEQLTAAWSSAMKDLNGALGSIKGNVKNAGGLYDSYEVQLTESLSNADGAADWDGAKFRF